jgi:hypothetical protein
MQNRRFVNKALVSAGRKLLNNILSFDLKLTLLDRFLCITLSQHFNTFVDP